MPLGSIVFALLLVRSASAGELPSEVDLGVVSTVARKPPLSVAIAIFGIVC